jgi:hypothetical protein
MNITGEMQAFLLDGYDRYADAKDAVTTFERELQERFMGQFEKAEWLNFNARRGDRGRGKAVHAGLSEQVGQPAVWAWNYDEKGNIIELGIQWGVHPSGRPFLYTRRWEQRFRKMFLGDPKPPIENREGLLTVVIGNGFDLETIAALLLTETDRALAIANAVPVDH